MKNLAVKIRLLEFATEIQASPDFCTCTTLQYVNRFFVRIPQSITVPERTRTGNSACQTLQCWRLTDME